MIYLVPVRYVGKRANSTCFVISNSGK